MWLPHPLSSSTIPSPNKLVENSPAVKAGLVPHLHLSIERPRVGIPGAAAIPAGASQHSLSSIPTPRTSGGRKPHALLPALNHMTWRNLSSIAVAVKNRWLCCLPRPPTGTPAPLLAQTLPTQPLPDRSAHRCLRSTRRTRASAHHGESWGRWAGSERGGTVRSTSLLHSPADCFAPPSPCFMAGRAEHTNNCRC